jgi:hypothetical protein
MGTSIVPVNQKHLIGEAVFFVSNVRTFPTRRVRKVWFDSRMTDGQALEIVRGLQKQIQKYSDFA